MSLLNSLHFSSQMQDIFVLFFFSPLSLSTCVHVEVLVDDFILTPVQVNQIASIRRL